MAFNSGTFIGYAATVGHIDPLIIGPLYLGTIEKNNI